MTDSPLRLALVGFHGTSLATLQLFFDRHATAYTLVEPATADALVYHADQALPLAQQWQHYQAQYAKPGLVITLQAVDWPGMIVVKKPYSTETLSNALASLQQQLQLGQQSPCTPPEAGDQHLLDAVAQFRRQLGRGHHDHSEALQQLNDQAERRRIFQRLFLARKQAADEVLERLKNGTTAELYGNGNHSNGGHTCSNHSADLLHLTAVVVDTLSGTPTETDTHAPDEQQPDWLDQPLVLADQQQINACCGHRPDLNLSVPNHRQRIQFNPEGQLLSLAVAAMQRAHDEQTPIAIIGLHNHRMVYLPESGKFIGDLTTPMLIQMAHVRFRFGELRLQHCATQDADPLLLDDRFILYPAEQLIWQLACWSSRGRLIADIHLDMVFRLEHCPSPQMLIGLPYTSEILHAWLTESLTAEQLMQRLGVPQRNLFPIMTAAWILGWLRPQPPTPLAQVQQYR